VNDPRTFGFISQILSGRAALGGIVLDGTETIRSIEDGVVYRTSPAFRQTQFLAVNPLATQTDDNQDLGNVLEPEQQALLGCGPAYASPCSRQQALAWNNDGALAGSLTRDVVDGAPQFGGLDLMNADASVITQEFVGIKACPRRARRHAPEAEQEALLPAGHQLQPQRHHGDHPRADSGRADHHGRAGRVSGPHSRPGPQAG
jgi:hypothetical protein